MAQNADSSLPMVIFKEFGVMKAAFIFTAARRWLEIDARFFLRLTKNDYVQANYFKCQQPFWKYSNMCQPSIFTLFLARTQTSTCTKSTLTCLVASWKFKEFWFENKQII